MHLCPQEYQGVATLSHAIYLLIDLQESFAYIKLLSRLMVFSFYDKIKMFKSKMINKGLKQYKFCNREKTSKAKCPLNVYRT